MRSRTSGDDGWNCTDGAPISDVDADNAELWTAYTPEELANALEVATQVASLSDEPLMAGGIRTWDACSGRPCVLPAARGRCAYVQQLADDGLIGPTSQPPTRRVGRPDTRAEFVSQLTPLLGPDRLVAVDPIRRELRDYYEAEAAASTRGPAAGRRVAAAAAFAEMLRAEGRTRVLDVGAGPGTDASAFAEAGLTYVGIDLAVGNAHLARERGHAVIAASLFDLPFRSACFDAGWSMSTLMHVPADEFEVAMRAVLVPLRPGALLGIGMWGGADHEFRTTPGPDGTRRLFSLRTAADNRARLAAHGAIEQWEVWDAGPEDWEYHLAVIRLPSTTGADGSRVRL